MTGTFRLMFRFAFRRAIVRRSSQALGDVPVMLAPETAGAAKSE